MNPSDIKDKKAIAAKGDADIHSEAITRFANVMTREGDNRDLGVEDARFAQTQDGQLDDGDLDENSPDIPNYTFNLVAAAVDTVIGDHRQNEIGIRVRPNGDGADKKDADIRNGIIKSIQADSDFDSIDDAVFDETLNSGYGGYRVTTEYTNDDVNYNSFDQIAKIEGINSAVTSLFFGPSQKYDKSDALYAFLIWNEEISDFKAMYPEATVTDFDQEIYSTDNHIHWFGENEIRCAEYWRKVPVKRTIALVQYPSPDGATPGERKTIDLEDEKKVLDDLQAAGVQIIRQRTIDDWQVERYIMNGAEILKPVEKWAGKLIPLVPEFGKISNINGKQYVRGLIRFAKDAQRVYNFLRSTIVATVAKAPKDIHWLTPAMMKGHTERLSRMNIDDSPIQLFNIDPANPAMTPTRTGAPAVQQSLIEAAQTAKLDVQMATGVTPGTAQPTAGTDIDRRSGKAIEAQARRGDNGAYTFMSNHALSIQALGNVLNDIIPRIYDSTRQVQIMRQDGTTEEITINETVRDEQTGDAVIVNDLSKGRYAVTVDVGPAFATQRMEAADRLIKLSENPDSPYARLTPDLIVKFLDLPGDASEELHTRLRGFMIQEGIVQPTEEEAKELQPTEAQQAQSARQEQREQAEIDLIMAQTMQLKGSANKSISDAENKDVDSNQKATDSFNTLIDALVKKREAGFPLTVEDSNMIADAMTVIEDTADVLLEQPNQVQ